jgi:hypothetical protein
MGSLKRRRLQWDGELGRPDYDPRRYGYPYRLMIRFTERQIAVLTALVETGFYGHEERDAAERVISRSLEWLAVTYLPAKRAAQRRR